MKEQIVLPFLPGYMFDGSRVVSTGVALPASQHIHPETGELIYYVRPIFSLGGPHVGMYIKHQGVLNWIKTKKEGVTPPSA